MRLSGPIITLFAIFLKTIVLCCESCEKHALCISKRHFFGKLRFLSEFYLLEDSVQVKLLGTPERVWVGPQRLSILPQWAALRLVPPSTPLPPFLTPRPPPWSVAPPWPPAVPIRLPVRASRGHSWPPLSMGDAVSAVSVFCARPRHAKQCIE
jgi:hypothetical protein